MTYIEKIEEMKGLVNVIKLHARELSWKERSESDNIEAKLAFSLKDMTDRYKMEEVELKIKSMQAIIKLLKKE